MPASAADATAVNSGGTKQLLANWVIKFLINCNLVCRSEPESLPRNSPDWIILDNWVFDRSTSVDEMLAKAWRRFGTCLLVYKNLLQSLIY